MLMVRRVHREKLARLVPKGNPVLLARQVHRDRKENPALKVRWVLLGHRGKPVRLVLMELLVPKVRLDRKGLLVLKGLPEKPGQLVLRVRKVFRGFRVKLVLPDQWDRKAQRVHRANRVQAVLLLLAVVWNW